MSAGAVKDLENFSSRQTLSLIEFGAGEPGDEFLGSGWGTPEQGFVWSEGTFSTIEIPVEQPVSQASFSIWGYVPVGSAPQRVLLFGNGLLLAATEVGDRTILSADLRMIPSGNKKLLFHLYLPQAKSPQEAEGVPDARVLGIALANLSLE